MIIYYRPFLLCLSPRAANMGGAVQWATAYIEARSGGVQGRESIEFRGERGKPRVGNKIRGNLRLAFRTASWKVGHDLGALNS